MIRLAYSTFGLTQLPILDAIGAVARAGYAGIEIAFHRDQLNPYDLGADELDSIKFELQRTGLVPACVATASHFFMPSRPHEPSLVATDLAGRKRRIDLIRRGIRVARHLGAPLVTFGSGFLRPEHARHPALDPFELLAESVYECLSEIHDDEDITLVIEPEPGMLVETLDQGLALIDVVGSGRFALHIDLCHAYCSDADYIAALGRAASRARYLHLSDARAGWNLKIVEDTGDVVFNLDFASTLVYFPESADFLLVDREHPLYFCDDAPTATDQAYLKALLVKAGVKKELKLVDYPSLYAGASPLDDEIFTYLISVPHLSFDVLERARPIVAFLRGVRGPALVEKMVANTRTGMVHFHDIPGKGTLDLAGSFRALNDNGFDGFGAVELYHHVAAWQEALSESHRHLTAMAQEV